MISPVRTSVNRPAAAIALNLSRGRDQLVAHRVLHAQVDRKLDRLLQPVGGEAGQVQIGEPARVEPFLDAGDALVVDIDVTDDVRDLGAVRIDALVLGQEADAGKAEPVDLLALLGRDLALEPDEAALAKRAARAAPPASRSGSTAVSSSDASSTSMIRRGSANSEGVRTSVARISPLRSRMSGRAVATASGPMARRAP